VIALTAPPKLAKPHAQHRVAENSESRPVVRNRMVLEIPTHHRLEPLQRFHVWRVPAQSCGRPRMTRGQDGSLLLFLYDSFIHYSMPVYPDARKESTMQDNPNTDNIDNQAQLDVDRDDWEFALSLTKETPCSALTWI
jgi:hypothetical protein